MSNFKSKGSKYCLIDGVRCFVKYKLDRESEVCDFWVYPQAYQEPLHVQVEGVDVDDFKVNIHLSKLQLRMPDKKNNERTNSNHTDQTSVRLVPTLEFDMFS